MKDRLMAVNRGIFCPQNLYAYSSNDVSEVKAVYCKGNRPPRESPQTSRVCRPTSVLHCAGKVPVRSEPTAMDWRLVRELHCNGSDPRKP